MSDIIFINNIYLLQQVDKHDAYTARICYELSLLYAEQDDQHALALKYAQRALFIRQARVSPNKTEL